MTKIGIISIILVILMSVTALVQEDKTKQPDDKPKKPKDQTEFLESGSPLKPVDPFYMPYSANQITQEDIRDKITRTMPESLIQIPGISIQKTAHGHGSPFIRGFTGFRNILTVDGIRLNNSVFREGPNQYWNTLDSFMLNRIEVLKGPASVLYGSDSIGGTVITSTKEPKTFEKGFHSNAANYFRYSSSEGSFTERGEIIGNYDSLGLFAGLTIRDYGDLTTAKLGRLENSGYDEYDADLKFVYKLAEKEKIVVAYQRTRQDDVPRTHRTKFAESWHGTTVGTDLRHDFDQERDLIYAQYHKEDIRNSFMSDVSISISLHRHAEEFVRVTSTKKQEFRSFAVNTAGLWAKAGSQISIGYLTYGFEYYSDDVQSQGKDISSTGAITEFDRGEVADDSDYQMLGIFIQDEFSPQKNLSIILGARYSLSIVDAGAVDPAGFGAAPLASFDKSFRAIVGNARLLYSLNDNFNLIGGISQGFRAPVLDDLTAVKLVMSGQTDYPSPNLDPEKSITYEVGLRAKFPGTFQGNTFLFFTDLDDFIRRVSAPSISPTAFQKDNFGGGFVKGFEIEGRYNVTQTIALFGDFSWVIGNADALVGNRRVERPLAKVNPTMIHLGINYEMIPSQHWIEFVVTAARHQDRLAPEESGEIANDFQRIPPDGTPGYTIYSLRMYRELNKNFLLNLGVDNIGNKAYRVHGSGQNEPGTNFLIGLTSKF